VDVEVLPAELAICRLEPGEQVPAWARGGLVATVRTGDEYSVVCDAEEMPEGIDCSKGWRALRVAGTLDLSLTGVLARLLAPLAEEEVPIFAVSSFDTDYVLVPSTRLDDARQALARAGHDVA
jgi:hypothetical protein